jgi:tRNA threonylcarbamoyl adenosine modification protein YeaZ
MITLGIDTSSAVSSIALVRDGIVYEQRQHTDAKRHAETLAPMIAEILTDRSSISNIACGVGPGPYTGVRAGVATAQALALALGVPVFGICSLDAIAEDVRETHLPQQPFTVGIDAKRAEMYWAQYASDGTRVAGPRISPREDVAGFGPPQWYPHAVSVATLAQRALANGAVISPHPIVLSAHGTDDGSTEQALKGQVLLAPRPLYVRRPDVTL